MQIVEEWAVHVYRGEQRARRLGIPPEKEVAQKLLFEMDDFEQQKLTSPLFEVYRYVSGQLELPTQQISVYLPRKTNPFDLFSPSLLEFKAYQGAQDEGVDATPTIMVSYDRRLFGKTVFFDYLDVPTKDDLTLEQTVDVIKHNAYSNIGERIIITHTGTTITLEDLSRPVLGSSEIEERNTGRIAVYCKVPWLERHKLTPMIQVKFLPEDARRAAEKVKDIFDSYMRSRRK